MRGDADPDRVADRLGIGEYLAVLRARYRADRAAYHALRRRVADRRQPAETWGPDDVLDVPVGPDPLADEVVDAAVALVRQALGGVVVADAGRVTLWWWRVERRDRRPGRPGRVRSRRGRLAGSV